MTDAISAPSDIDRIRAHVGQMAAAVVGLTALGLALRARVSGPVMPPVVQDAVEGMLQEAGLAQAVRAVDADAVAPVVALIRAEMLMGGHLVTEGLDAPGWQDREAAVMQAFGEVSLGFWRNVERLAPPDLLARLEARGARFLDVGTGVGWLSMGMLRRWPQLAAVGIEPLPGALAMARDNLTRAGLADRMALRQGVGQDLRDVAAFDLIFVPGAFIPGEVLPAILLRARAALRPGGWVMLAVLAPDAAQVVPTRFRAAVWGGDVMGMEGAMDLVRGAGLADIRPHPPENGMIGFVLAQG